MTPIPIERLSAGTLIYREGGDFSPFGNFAQVMSIKDEGPDGYWVRVLIDGWREEVGFRVMPGESVMFGGVGEPVLAGSKERKAA